MADIKTPEDRSKNMRAIRSKDTKPELYIRRKMFAEGYRYRKNVKSLPGRPDLYFARYHAAVFIHGCFWHRHINCKYAYSPKSREDYWQNKFMLNKQRDQRVRSELEKHGLRCLIIWECTIRKMMRSEEFEKEVVSQIIEFLRGEAEILDL